VFSFGAHPPFEVRVGPGSFLWSFSLGRLGVAGWFDYTSFPPVIPFYTRCETLIY